MACAILWNNKVLGGTLSGGYSTVPVASMPLTNMADPQPRLRARVVGATATFQVDFGASASIRAMALIGTNLGATATVRWRLSDAELMVPTTYDSTAIDADTSDAAAGNVVHVMAAAATGRYLRVDISSPGAETIDVGRLVAGPLWVPSYSYAYGISEDREIRDRRDVNPFTGAEFAVPAVVNPRRVTFSLQAITRAEAEGEYRSMQRQSGGAGDILFIPDTALAQDEMNLRAIWGAANQPGFNAVSRTNFRLWSRSFSITERV